jgi:hypothetical protein
VKKRSPVSGGYHTADNSVSEIVTSLAQELVEKKLNFPKTVIFCKLDVCGKGYEIAQRIIRKAIMNGITDFNIRLISQYHAACTEEVHIALNLNLNCIMIIVMIIATLIKHVMFVMYFCIEKENCSCCHVTSFRCYSFAICD